MAESFAGFDSIAAIPTDTVRTALRRTMVMALPSADVDKPTFYFERQVTWADYDSENSPWDWSSAPLTDTQQAAIRPICAWEFFAPVGRQGAFPTEVGEFNPVTVVFTMLADEFGQVNGSSYVTVGPPEQDGGYIKYWFRYWRPSYGLDTMQIYQVHCVAQGVN